MLGRSWLQGEGLQVTSLKYSTVLTPSQEVTFPAYAWDRSQYIVPLVLEANVLTNLLPRLPRIHSTKHDKSLLALTQFNHVIPSLK